MFKLFFSFMLLFSVQYAWAQSENKIEKEIFELVNEHRVKKGLPALEMNATIAAAAAKHSRNMASKRVSPGHSGFDDRMDKLLQQIKGSNATAENVAFGARTAQRVVDMWLDSKGHRKNIEGNYNLTGIGVSRSKDGTLYYTQIFIRKK